MPWPLPSPPSPPESAPWPRSTAARPPRCALSCRAPHRGCSTPRACRASGRWPRGRPWLLCVCPAERCTARLQLPARRTHRPTARRPGLPSPPSREPAADAPLHPLTSSDAPSLLCGFPGQLTQHQYVVGTFSLTQIGQTSCFSRSSPISDGSRAQPKQARLGASDADKGVPPLPAAGGAATAGGVAAAASAAASVASPSALSAISASRTSLLPAARSGCCSRSLASSGLGPRPGSASHSPRTASRRASAIGATQRVAPIPYAVSARAAPTARALKLEHAGRLRLVDSHGLSRAAVTLNIN
eukprot:scaffold30768_cov68-Phaeocystis_antarctica.AAC.3